MIPKVVGMLEQFVTRVERGESLSMDEMAEAIGQIMAGRCAEAWTERLLVALHHKGEAVTEVAGAALALRRQMTPIRATRCDVLDTCGTGGDGSRTFNISTAAALVAGAAGVAVAKHGNRGITSRSGSADVLAELGVRIDAGLPCVEACLEELGICFCYAPLLHEAMRHVAPVRKRLPHPTIFNILGPLANPARAELQLLGVGKQPLQPLMAAALALLGTRRALVVHGVDGLDEVTLSGTTQVLEASPTGAREHRWTPADFGLEPSDRAPMLVDGPAESAALIRGILGGRRGPPRDIVVANAAAALWISGRSDSLLECARQAAEAIDCGAAQGLLRRLVERTRGG
jgi:anthranilate phosphoribosyltransferase